MRYGITGFSSSIAQSFIRMPDKTGERVEWQSVLYRRDLDGMPLDLDRYLLCAGVLHGKEAKRMTEQDMWETMRVNYLEVAVFCDALFEVNPNARVCAVGSISGIEGSHDTIYAGSKAALHLYVEKKKLHMDGQHLVAVAPTIIADSGMTKRRIDYEKTMRRGEARRLGRWLTAEEVARTCIFALENDAMCNTVVKLTGGNW